MLPLPDILSQGGDREPRRWPRRLAVLAVLALLTVLIVEHLPRHHAGSVPPVPLTASSVPPGPDGVPGPVLAWRRDSRVPLNGQRPAWFSPATGQDTPIRGLPGDLYGYQFVRLASGWAVQAGTDAAGGCGTCAGQSRPVYYLADGAPAATALGTADLVARGAGGTAWLTSYPPGARMTTAAGTARQVTSTGRVTGRPVRLPPGYRILQGTRQGLLLQPVASRPGTWLWRPGGPPRRLAAGVIAASADAVAWMPACARRCQVVIADLDSGRRTVVRLPPGSSVANAVFSPDGSLLALQLSVAENGDDDALAMRLDVASAATGALTEMPGSFVSSDAMVGFGWPGADATLVAELSFTSKVQLVSWQPGAARPAVAQVSPQQTALALVVG